MVLAELAELELELELELDTRTGGPIIPTAIGAAATGLKAMLAAMLAGTGPGRARSSSNNSELELELYLGLLERGDRLNLLAGSALRERIRASAAWIFAEFILSVPRPLRLGPKSAALLYGATDPSAPSPKPLRRLSPIKP